MKWFKAVDTLHVDATEMVSKAVSVNWFCTCKRGYKFLLSHNVYSLICGVIISLLYCDNPMSSSSTSRPATIDIMEVLMPPKVLSITTPHYKYHHNYANEIRYVQRM